VVARFHLEALSADETAQYIRHRLAVAGMKRSIPFDRSAMQRIHALSRGVPRRINLLCDRALLGAYAAGKSQVDNAIVDKAAGEVFDKTPAAVAAARFNRPGWIGAALGVAAGAVLVGVVTVAMDRGSRDAPVAAKPPAPAASVATVAASAPVRAASAPAPLAIAPADLPLRFATLTRDEKDAWRELASAWKLSLAPAGDPCLAALRQQVHCFRLPAGNLAMIRQLGRPGIVTLHDDADKPVYALLTGLGADRAQLRMNGVTQTVSLASLASMWRGDFATLWRAPTGYSERAVGEGGPAAVWLGDRLVQLHPAAASAPLRARIQAFQLAQGLRADGLPGPMTFMQLNRAVGIDEPRLDIEG
jgi:general secretion pathway protein A